MTKYITWFEELTKEDLPIVGGKGANIGEMIRAKFPVPSGFAITVEAYKEHLKASNLVEKIEGVLSGLDVNDTKKLHEASDEISQFIIQAKMPPAVNEAIKKAYRELCERIGEEVRVAVRSSATAEDLPTASFAGQQASFLNVSGEDSLIEAVQKCWASLFTPRAIFYREKHGIDHSKVFISVLVQQMVDADAAGVIFTAHPTTGERDKIVIESSWGLGESLVSGGVTPDRFVIDKNTFEILERQISDKKIIMRTRDPKTSETITIQTPKEKVATPSLSDEEIVKLAEFGRAIEEHYGFPQDIEWAIERGRIRILQTRAITTLEKAVEITELEEEAILVKGVPASPGLGSGPVRIILDVKASYEFNEGDVLVTKMTNPDWVPLMRKAVGIVTDEGGVTCHAAIVSRELGIPCIVGSKTATTALKSYISRKVTVDGSHGIVYSGIRRAPTIAPAPEIGAAQEVAQPITATKVYVNLSIPELAEKVFRESKPDGVGLLRAEHMLLSIGKHPRKLIEEGGEDRMINAFAEGIRKVAEVFYPRPVVYRFLDFKPDEFLGLEGGEIEREKGHIGPNPMLGYRGAFRYRKEPEIFRLECRAVKLVREKYGLKNVWVMIPFVRNVEDLIETKKVMAEEGIVQGPDFKLWIMIEVPNTVFIIDKLIEQGIDGVSFGTNDLTMLILGIDRGDASVAEIYDERNIGVLRALSHVIKICREKGVTTSICGQAPSVYPEYCEFLVREGVTSVSVNPDVVVATRRLIASIEQKILLEGILEGRKGSSLWKPIWEF